MISKKKQFVSVVVYIHNAEKELPAFLNYIVVELEKNFENGELIFVNDASEDNGVSIIKEYLENRKSGFATSIINMSSYHGMEASMLAGVDLAIGDFIYEFDRIVIDYPSELFMDVYHEMLKGNDIVAASPEEKAEFPASLFYALYNRFRLSGKDVEKLKRETFRLVSRRAVNRVQTLGKSIPYRKVMYQNCGLEYKSLMYQKTVQVNKGGKRRYQKNEMENREMLAFDTFLMFTNAVQKVAMAISILFLAFTLLTGLYVVIVYFSTNKPVEGWAPVMGFLAASFTGVFILLTIILKYMAVLLAVSFEKKRYLISSIEKIGS
jgi:dolichol-phosphate mannosyltransferase